MIKRPLLSTLLALVILPQCYNVPSSLKEEINELYGAISGFGISNEDTNLIESHGCASTYGEITFEGVETLLKLLKLKDTDVFYDLGCGVGKMVVQVYLDSPVKKSAGIELSSERAESALKIKQQLQVDNKIKAGRTLVFYKESFLDVDLSDATVIYLASTCFSDDIMKKVTDRLATLKKGLRVATLKKLAENDKFALLDQFILPMTWSDSTPVYLYELQ